MSQIVHMSTADYARRFFSGSGVASVIRTAIVVGGAQVATLEAFQGGSAAGGLPGDEKKLVLRSPANDSRGLPDMRLDWSGDLMLELKTTGVGAEAIIQLD